MEYIGDISQNQSNSERATPIRILAIGQAVLAQYKPGIGTGSREGRRELTCRAAVYALAELAESRGDDIVG